MKIYIIWLIGVIIWNFGVPNATPIEDVLVAILLSFKLWTKKISKVLTTLKKNKYFDSKQ